MGDEFYAIIKLVSGEEILSLVCPDENDGDAVLILQNPITMKMLETPHGIHVKVKSWMELASDNFFIIRPDKILTMTETHDKRMIEIYTNYLLKMIWMFINLSLPLMKNLKVLLNLLERWDTYLR